MLATLAKIKPMLEISEEDSSQDQLLEALLVASSTAIENYCRRSFGYQEHKDVVVDGVRGKSLLLPNYPVHSVSAVSFEDGMREDFELDAEKGILFRRAGWPCGERAITVSYTAGYVLPGDATAERPQTLPRVLEIACMLLTQTLMRDPGASSERVGDISVSYSADERGLPYTVRALIDPYKRFA
ncbi:phage head-tail connector protein [Paenibacillus caseinilyticus]|uniref:phage head-tail connector protein n=1 Tax=Paenibacillus caseinilyticus TaxID=3098138 RepID=UPI0022B85B63|nr:phage head-tail connector protein [Paenibacillus caseinilyticus]MCZ8518880.1 phage head-tail connector protein [Paenibacillus caseinilyticus]